MLKRYRESELERMSREAILEASTTGLTMIMPYRIEREELLETIQEDSKPLNQEMEEIQRLNGPELDQAINVWLKKESQMEHLEDGALRGQDSNVFDAAVEVVETMHAFEDALVAAESVIIG